MKKLFFISALFLSTFLFQNRAAAQLLSVDNIAGMPDTVIDNQTVGLSIFVTNSGGALFSGDLTLYIHALNDSGPADTIFALSQYVISGNTTSDTIENTFTFQAADMDAGDNIVVVWPASTQHPTQVSGDSLYFNIFLKNVGVDEYKHRQSVKLYPNPSRSEVKLFYGFPEKVEQVRVLDILGKVIYSFEDAVSGINVENLEDGIYLVEVKSHEGGLVVKKFFKE